MPADGCPFQLLKLHLSQEIEVAERVLERDSAELAQGGLSGQKVPLLESAGQAAVCRALRGHEHMFSPWGQTWWGYLQCVARRRKRERESPKRRWRDYRTRAGRRPVKEFLDSLSDSDAADITAALADVQKNGIRAAKPVGDEIYEVRAEGIGRPFGFSSHRRESTTRYCSRSLGSQRSSRSYPGMRST
jgi:hypothetical protein